MILGIFYYKIKQIRYNFIRNTKCRNDKNLSFHNGGLGRVVFPFEDLCRLEAGDTQYLKFKWRDRILTSKPLLRK